MTNYVNSQSTYRCGGTSDNIAKALASKEGWNTSTSNCAVGNDLTANNATGFSAVPAGRCGGSPFEFHYAGYNAHFWSSTQKNNDYAYFRGLYFDHAVVSSDNQLFLNFLGMLRNKYLQRSVEGLNSTFHSVILAGVYDVKNLKLKLRPDAEKKYNSPWNIATDFNVDMTFHPEEIAQMLRYYENDRHTGMDIKAISEEIYRYTNGYPFLVSYICKLIDEQFSGQWDADGILRAVKYIVQGGAVR